MPVDAQGNEIDDNGNVVQGSQGPKELREALDRANAKIKEHEDLATENAQLKQTAALKDAGLELNDDQRAALLLVHKGEVTPEAFRTTAEALKFAEPIPAVDPADQQAHAALAGARAGVQSPPDAAQYDIDMDNAKSPAEVRAVAIKHGVPWQD